MCYVPPEPMNPSYVETKMVDLTNEREETWTLHFRCGIVSYLIGGRKRGGKKLNAQQIPQFLREWATVHKDRPHDGIARLENETTRTVIENCRETNPEVIAITRRKGGLEIFVTGRWKVPHITREERIVIYCEVGDSGHCVSDTFPVDTPTKRIERARRDIEEYVAGLEIETGWVDRS